MDFCDRKASGLRASFIAVVAAAMCLAVASCAAQGPQTTSANSSPIVDAPAGAVEGVAEGALRVFKGIPFALPPVGEARWRPPAPMARWPDVKQATAFGAACMQRVRATDSIYLSDVGAVSEDCLTLNIWAPADARNAPVFVWIHGGALTAGSSSEQTYDGARLAEQGLVVVSINYRLGVLGYMAHPQLSAESASGVSGNYGLLDQIEALRWVRRNITAFGGDAGNVTIAGESAGALSVMYLMVAPDARGLFHKAIAQSAYMITSPELKAAKYGYPSAEEAGVRLAATLGAPDLAALRAMDASALFETSLTAGFTSLGVVDGRVLPRQLVEAFEHGAQARVPLLSGFNSGEIRSLRVLAPPPPANAAEYERIIRAQYGDLAGEFLRLYPSSNMQESIWATTRDALYGWTSERMSRMQTALGAPAYLYLFDHGYPAADEAGLHAFHASEIPFVFGNLDRTGQNWPKIPDTPTETGLSEAMVGYWTSFARTGAPRAPNAPDWPAYGASRAYMLFTDQPRPAERVYPGMYELHEEAVCRRRAADQPWHWNAGLISPQLAPASCN